MFLNALILMMAYAPPLSFDVEVSPAVSAVAAKYGKEFGPEAERELQTLSENGDRTASALLGELLMFGAHSDGRNLTLACNYSEAAGAHASALHNLAVCFETGEGRSRDLTRARELYEKAAELGFAKAACALGNMLVEGRGGPSNPARGLDLCRRAADAGEPDAQTDYAGYLLTGEHIAKNAVEARRYLFIAAARGQSNAAFLLGQIHWNGDGTDMDVGAAAKWWKVAYEGGRTDAAALIGRAALKEMLPALQSKQPVSASALEAAKHWFGIAALKDPDADQRRKATEIIEMLNALTQAR